MTEEKFTTFVDSIEDIPTKIKESLFDMQDNNKEIIFENKAVPVC